MAMRTHFVVNAVLGLIGAAEGVLHIPGTARASEEDIHVARSGEFFEVEIHEVVDEIGGDPPIQLVVRVEGAKARPDRAPLVEEADGLRGGPHHITRCTHEGQGIGVGDGDAADLIAIRIRVGRETETHIIHGHHGLAIHRHHGQCALGVAGAVQRINV